MPVTVRRATLADVDALTPLFDGYRQFYGQPGNPVRAQDFLAERLARGESVVFLAEEGGETLGFAQLYPSFSSVHTARLWILNDLFVRRERRHRGAARALLGACVEFGRETGAVGLQLETQRTNTVAQALYVEQGWELDEEFCSFHYPLREHG
jgi:GNAT superfamily N-acetyltransferase